MQVTSPPRSSTATARRAQIVRATIEVVAEQGFGSASFAAITERAGLSSSRLISYHFVDKQELVGAVVQHVLTAIGGAVGRRVHAETTSAGRLQAYIEGVVGFTAEHRADMRALLLIALAGALPAGSGADDPVPPHVEAILRQGQRDGEFRDFDASVVALAVQRSVEALPFALEADPDLDCDAFAAELTTLFHLATTRTDRG